VSRDADPRPVISGAVLAGGASKRMGRDKALIEVDGRPLALYVADRLLGCSDDVFVVAKRELGFPVVIDDLDLQTPLAGIMTALRSAKHEVVFICACDMPLVSADLVVDLASRADEHDAVVPERGGRTEPLHVVWAVRSLPKIEELAASGERAVHRILERLDVVTVEVGDDPSFTNVNTPEELERVLRKGR
jgi:molybdenum cofactor guanylyltransferase